MKICLISPFFYPEPISTGKYNAFLAKELKSHGVELTVFCSHPIYPEWKVSPNNEQLEGIKIVRGGSKIIYPKSATFRRAILELWFAAFVFKNVVFKKNIFDKYILIFPPSLFALLLTSSAKRKKNIYGIIHDLQGVYARKSKTLAGKLLQWLIKSVEKKSFDNCSHLIFLSNSMLESAAKEYQLDKNKCSINYPFIALPEGNTSKSNKNILPTNIISPQKFNFVYSGALGEKQNPLGLLDLMIKLSDRFPEIDFHIFSAGPIFEEIKNIGKNSKVRFHDLVDAEHLAALYRRSNIQVIPQAVGTADGSLPSKLPNLLTSNTPILAICEKNTELDLLLSNIEKVAVCTSWDPNTLINEAINFINEIKDNTTEEFGPSRRMMLEKFDIDILIRKLLA